MKEKTHFITGEKVKTYSYFDSPVQNLANKIESYFFLHYKITLTSALVDGENIFVFAHAIYKPIEFFGNFFNFKYIGKFYRDNLHDLKEFNSFSDAKKSELYKNFSKYYPFFLYSERFLQFADEINTYSKNPFKYNAKSLLVEEFENLFVKETEEDYYKTNRKFPSYERFYYSFAEYKVILIESDRFANWFNGINVRTSNTNFEPELARKYKLFIIKLENPKESD